MRGLFVTGTGTGAGKTTVTAALARALIASGRDVVALKPIETGVDGIARDAALLAGACGRPELADDAAWYRAHLPVSPYAATRSGEPPVVLGPMVARARELGAALLGAGLVLVEGAGGLMVPLTAGAVIADLASELGLPLLLVAPDRLGVLSDVLTTCECAGVRGLAVVGVVLNQVDDDDDPSRPSNAAILRERLECPVIMLGHAPDGRPHVPDELAQLALLAASSIP